MCFCWKPFALLAANHCTVRTAILWEQESATVEIDNFSLAEFADFKLFGLVDTYSDQSTQSEVRLVCLEGNRQTRRGIGSFKQEQARASKRRASKSNQESQARIKQGSSLSMGEAMIFFAT